MLEASVKEGDKLVAHPVKGSTPDADGLVSIETTATIGDVTIGDIDVTVAHCEKDAIKSTPYTDGGVSDLSTDKNGKIWEAGKNLADQVMNAEDVNRHYTYDGSKRITQIRYTSESVRTLNGYTTLKVEENISYVAGEDLVEDKNRVLTIT